jgi:hypothetical protein
MGIRKREQEVLLNFMDFWLPDFFLPSCVPDLYVSSR